MESPVVLDKPPEYHSNGSQDNDKGFPFEEDDEGGSGDRWSDLAARHPDIAARLRARPWARKRRSSQPGRDHTADDFVSGLGEHFNRFPFDDIPSEFREHFPEHFGQRHAPQERVHPTAEHSQPQSRPERSTIATQTEEIPTARDSQPSGSLPQYGLRNTVDLGQKTPVDPSLVDADDRNQRSMSAPPENRVPHPGQHSMGNMSGGHQQQEQEHASHNNQHGGQPNVRHIPIFVEGRDEPVINKKHPEPSAPAPEPQGHAQQQYASPLPPQRQYFERDAETDFHHPNYSRQFGGSPFAKGFRAAPTHQPFAPHMAYQQHAAPQGRSQSPKPQGRSQSPKPQGRSQSPKPQAHQQQYTQIPVQHEPPKQPNHQHPQQHQHFQQQQQRQQSPQPPHHEQPPPPQQAPPQQATPPPQHPPANDPISKILHIQKDVLDLMNEVESYVGNKKDKKYIYLDEMLTRNLIKLDDIETEGKDNIRQARREAIKCIQKCIAVLEAKAEGRIPSTPQPNTNNEQPGFDSNEEISEQEKPAEAEQINATKEQSQEQVEDNKQNSEVDNKQNSDAVPEKMAESAANEPQKPSEDDKLPAEEAKGTPKKTKKVVKKRDKSKDKNAAETGKIGKEKNADVEMKESNPESPAQPMETDAAAVPSH